MKIALINPPMPYLVVPDQQAPLGLLYLSAMIKRHRSDVGIEVLNLSGSFVEEAAGSIGEFDVYGYTATCTDYLNVVGMSRLVRARFPKALQIIGGPHATLSNDEEMTRVFDSIFVGEAEHEILRFIDDFEMKRTRRFYFGEPGLDLDFLPFPDREALGKNQGGKVMVSQEGQSTVIMGSRGCPFNCAFCASNALWTRNVRWRSVENLVEEIRHVINVHGVKTFRFSDDNMTSNKKRLLDFCDRVKDLGIRWRMSVRVDSLDDEVLKAVREAGCADVNLGVESFDPDVLVAMNKMVSPEDSIDAIQRVASHGINARLLMMISTPGETHWNTVKKNILCLEKLGDKFTIISLKTLVPFPGTDIWNDPKKYGVEIIDRNLRSFNYFMYEKGPDGKPVETPIHSNLRITGMTREQQLDNIVQMRKYVASLPQNNEGK